MAIRSLDMERRSNKRIRKQLSAQLLIGEALMWWVDTADLGLRGSRITPAPAQARQGLPCILVLMVASEPANVIAARGRITHVDRCACGICFHSLDPRDFDTLHTMVLEALHPEHDITPEILAGHIPDLVDWGLALGEIENRRP